MSDACTRLNNHQYETALASLQVYCQQLNYNGVKKRVLKSTLSGVLHSARHAKEASACSYTAYIEEVSADIMSSTLPKCPGLTL